jgi:hypothetical protein
LGLGRGYGRSKPAHEPQTLSRLFVPGIVTSRIFITGK